MYPAAAAAAAATAMTKAVATAATTADSAYQHGEGSLEPYLGLRRLLHTLRLRTQAHTDSQKEQLQCAGHEPVRAATHTLRAFTVLI